MCDHLHQATGCIMEFLRDQKTPKLVLFHELILRHKTTWQQKSETYELSDSSNICLNSKKLKFKGEILHICFSVWVSMQKQASKPKAPQHCFWRLTLPSVLAKPKLTQKNECDSPVEASKHLRSLWHRETKNITKQKWVQSWPCNTMNMSVQQWRGNG